MSLKNIGMLLALGTLVTTFGCSQAESGKDAVQVRAAKSFPGAVTLDGYKAGKLSVECSGTLLSPTAVLTAGHCVQGMSTWKIHAPYAGATGQSAGSVGGEIVNYNSGEPGAKTLKWVAIVYLDTPIDLPRYPKIGDPNKCKSTGCDVYVVSREAAFRDGAQSTKDLPASGVGGAVVHAQTGEILGVVNGGFAASAARTAGTTQSLHALGAGTKVKTVKTKLPTYSKAKYYPAVAGGEGSPLGGVVGKTSKPKSDGSGKVDLSSIAEGLNVTTVGKGSDVADSKVAVGLEQTSKGPKTTGSSTTKPVGKDAEKAKESASKCGGTSTKTSSLHLTGDEEDFVGAEDEEGFDPPGTKTDGGETEEAPPKYDDVSDIDDKGASDDKAGSDDKSDKAGTDGKAADDKTGTDGKGTDDKSDKGGASDEDKIGPKQTDEGSKPAGDVKC